MHTDADGRPLAVGDAVVWKPPGCRTWSPGRVRALVRDGYARRTEAVIDGADGLSACVDAGRVRRATVQPPATP
jgi:hypothetical protein